MLGHSRPPRSVTHGKINNHNTVAQEFFFFYSKQVNTDRILYNKPLVIYPKPGILGLVDDGQT